MDPPSGACRAHPWARGREEGPLVEDLFCWLAVCPRRARLSQSCSSTLEARQIYRLALVVCGHHILQGLDCEKEDAFVGEEVAA